MARHWSRYISWFTSISLHPVFFFLGHTNECLLKHHNLSCCYAFVCLFVCCPAGAAAGLFFLRVSFFFLATRLFRILPDIRFRPNLVIVTSTWTTTQAQTMMGSEVTIGSLGSKWWFSQKMLFLLQITWYGHVTHIYWSAIYPLQKLWV